jgi:hypothetical protein
MLLKKLLFLSLPLILLYWRSRTAQQALRWLFRGVLPQDGAFGKVLNELRQAPDGTTVTGDTARGVRPRPNGLAARVANNWPAFLAFVAGVTITAIMYARFARPE